MKLVSVPLDRIRPNPWQTRLAIEHTHVLPLAQDIARNGLMHPPAGRLVIDNAVYSQAPVPDLAAFRHLLEGAAEWDPAVYVQLAVGHNRAAAYDVLAYGPAHRFPELEGVVEGPAPDPGRYGYIPMQLATYSDEQMARAAWAENAQRKDLTPLEEARAIKRVMDDFGWSQAEAAEHFGLARATIANKLRLLQLPPAVQDGLHRRAISERSAGALLPLYQLPPEVQARTAKTGKNGGWSEPEIRARAVEGASSDDLRRWTQQAIARATVRHDGHAVPYDFELTGNSGVRAAKCSECPLLISAAHARRCGDEACYEIRLVTWRELLTAHVPLPLYTGERYLARLFEDTEWSADREHGRAILAAGCPHGQLHVIHLPHMLEPGRAHDHLHIEGLPEVGVCCADHRCKCLAARRAAAKPAPTAEQLAEQAAEEAAKKQWIAEVRRPLERRLAAALEAMNQDAWRLVAETGLMRVQTAGKPWSGLCAAVASKIIGHHEIWNPWREFEAERARMAQWIAAAGIPAADDES